jgi:hypothetical protein
MPYGSSVYGTSTYGDIVSVPSDPVVTPPTIGDELYEMFFPLLEIYGDASGHLYAMCIGLGSMLQPIDDIVGDGDNDEPGYSLLLDLNRVPDTWLPWLAQWVGYFVSPLPTSDAERTEWSGRERRRTVTNSAHRRGTIARMVEEVQEHLQDTKTVIIHQRDTSPHHMTLYYYTDELITTHAALNAAAQAQKAKGLILLVVGISKSSWNTLVANQATWNVVKTKFGDWNEVVSNPSKP